MDIKPKFGKKSLMNEEDCDYSKAHSPVRHNVVRVIEKAQSRWKYGIKWRGPLKPLVTANPLHSIGRRDASVLRR